MSRSHSLGALAELERKAQETESAQARADLATLLSTADEYALRQLGSGERHEPVLFDVTDADLSTSLQMSVYVSECITHGRMPMQITTASSRHTSSIALKGRVAAEKGDRVKHSYCTFKLARCIFLPSMLVAAVYIRGTVAL